MSYIKGKEGKTKESQASIQDNLSEASDQYDSEIAKFLESKALEGLDSYLSGGLIDQERHLRLKEAISKA